MTGLNGEVGFDCEHVLIEEMDRNGMVIPKKLPQNSRKGPSFEGLVAAVPTSRSTQHIGPGQL